MKQISALTSLRALLAFWVITRHLFHPFEDGVFFKLSASISAFDKGYLGVDGFFILSGFILGYNYTRGRKFEYREFIIARFARIYPVHLFCLLSATAVIIVCEATNSKSEFGIHPNTRFDLLTNFLLLNSWKLRPGTSWNDVAWSVSAEWFAYVFFPLFVWLSRAKNKATAIVMLAIPAGILAAVEHLYIYKLSIPGGLIRLIPEFYAGILLCKLREYISSAPRLSGIASLLLIASGVACDLDTVVVIGLAALIFSLSFEGDALALPLSPTAFVYLGEISYCLYMVQRLPQQALSF